MNSNWNYSLETLNWVKIVDFFGPCDLKIWLMTSRNHTSPLLCLCKALKEKETQHSFAGLLNMYISGIWMWHMQALFINRVKQNRCLKSENPQPIVVTILPPCWVKQMWMWCRVVSSPAWWLITPSPIPEAAWCQLLLRAGQLRYLNVSARKLP